MTDPALLALLTRIAVAVEGLRADLRRERAADARADLVAALADYFGPGTFTACGVLEVVAEAPTGALAFAVAAAVDLDTPSPAIALGRLFARMTALEPVGDRRGAGLYRVRAEVVA
jgi:hypothetical protein